MSLYLSLHTADPRSGGLHEAAFGGYRRVRVTADDFTFTEDQARNRRELSFPRAHKPANDVVTYWALRHSPDGEAGVVTGGPFSNTQHVGDGCQLFFNTGALEINAFAPQDMHRLKSLLEDDDGIRERDPKYDRIRVVDPAKRR